MTKKNYISAAICLAVSVAIMISTSMNFLEAVRQSLSEPSVTTFLSSLASLPSGDPKHIAAPGPLHMLFLPPKPQGSE